MTIHEMIKKYDIKLVSQNGQDMLGIRNKPTAPEIAEIKENKQNIIAEIKASKASAEAAAQAAARLAEEQLKTNVPGLDELRSAIADHERYHRAFERMMEDEFNDGANPPSRPTSDIGELKDKYPVAAAYLKAESWGYAGHYAKSGAGRRAEKRIAAGEDHEQALADMEAEWTKHCEEHIWD